MGVALSSTIRPAACESTFTLEEHEMGNGIGIHGEPERFTKKSSRNQLVESPLAVETKRILRAGAKAFSSGQPLA
jgi:dihydroxyacetone kinase